ncbi:putative ubiquitinyl hydrolase 1 [Rosa chinensis]|uniref:Putative ubiquitinyl hydrolase 1 n=1 Tax=Rosa chinensis TaxID=74649 RepID=A0A2P6R2B6_ROSCH|nr:putative ubiquitinyl hydrolase 1 [Rosa chinensis]
MFVVAQVEPASTVDNQPMEEPLTMKLTWTIESLSRLNTKKHYSDMFMVGGYKLYSSLDNHRMV